MLEFRMTVVGLRLFIHSTGIKTAHTTQITRNKTQNTTTTTTHSENTRTSTEQRPGRCQQKAQHSATPLANRRRGSQQRPIVIRSYINLWINLHNMMRCAQTQPTAQPTAQWARSLRLNANCKQKYRSPTKTSATAGSWPLAYHRLRGRLL